jgi:hypothetical protein
MRPLRQSLLATPAKRQYSSKPKKKPYSQARCILTLQSLEAKFNADQPTRLKNFFQDIPAYEKWFIRSTVVPEKSRQHIEKMKHSRKTLQRINHMKPNTLVGVSKLNTEYLENFKDTIVPLELTKMSPNGNVTFDRLEGPLSLLFSYIAAAKTRESQLYLAQHSLADLPEALQADLPTPELLKQLGRGDVYASSLWIGLAPTCTPLHRDPNPNLFVQLSGKKTVRLLKPEAGKEMYENVKAIVRGKTSKADGMANMRGDEMMQGEERRILERKIWKDESFNGVEVNVKRGDGLYIPLGWWHAVRGTGKGPNVSVSQLEMIPASSANRLSQANWWFR